MSPTPPDGDRQFVVIASEKQARVVALPSQNCVYRQQLADTDFNVKAEIVSLKGEHSEYTTNELRICHEYDAYTIRIRVRQTTNPCMNIVLQTACVW